LESVQHHYQFTLVEKAEYSVDVRYRDHPHLIQVRSCDIFEIFGWHTFNCLNQFDYPVDSLFYFRGLLVVELPKMLTKEYDFSNIIAFAYSTKLAN
jgi:hypothetical protein